jgi:ABC-2 type transport system permease protein
MRSMAILRLEWRMLRAGPALWIGCIAMLAAAGYGLWNGAAWTDSQRLPPQAETEKAPTHDPYVLSTQQQFAVLPPGPLSILSIGDSVLHPAAAKVYAWSTPGSLFAQSELHNPANLRAGRFDAGFTMIYLLPLFILTLFFDLLSADREGGTLAVIQSHPAPLLRVLLLKVLPRAAVVWSIILLCGLAAAAGIPFAALPRLALWTMAVCLYSGFWIALALAVNTAGYGSSTNGLILAGCWIVLAIAAPALIDNFIQAEWPLPPRSEVILAAEQAELNYARERQTAVEILLHEHPDYRPPDGSIPSSRGAGPSSRGAGLIAAFLREQPALEAVEQRHRHALDLRDAAAGRLQWLSPSIALQFALADLAGSGSPRYRHFRRQVDGFVREERAYFFKSVLRGEGVASGSPPRFHYVEEPLATVAARTAMPLGVIAAFLAVGALRFTRTCL